jgi:outer membrane protein TolC
MGVAGSFISVDDTPWIKKPAKLFDERAFEIDTHPLAVLRAAEVSTASAQVNSLDKTWRPHIYFHSAIWGRGSGATDPGHPAAGGTIPSVGNWVAGFSVSFPVLDYYAVRARRSMAAQNEQAQQATYDLALQKLMQKDARARVLLDNARRIADETPVLIIAAKDNESKALTRYRTGLCNIVEVAEAERILERAQVEDAVAEVRVWRSILAVSYAQGDLRPFMSLVTAAEATP